MNLSRISSGPVLGLISGYIFNSVVNRAWEILSNSSLNDFDFPKSTIITICIATTFFAIIATFYWINLREHKPHSDFLLSTIGKKEIPQELQEPVALGFDDFMREFLIQTARQGRVRIRQNTFNTLFD